MIATKGRYALRVMIDIAEHRSDRIPERIQRERRRLQTVPEAGRI